jgi:hypothetical protein
MTVPASGDDGHRHVWDDDQDPPVCVRCNQRMPIVDPDEIQDYCQGDEDDE